MSDFEDARKIWRREIERWTQAEQSAGAPAEASRCYKMRRNAERGLAACEERLKAERGLLPCPECREWSDLRSGTCPRCGERVDFAAVSVLTGAWQVHLAFGLIFGGLAAGLIWLMLNSAVSLWLKLPLAPLLIPAGWLAYLNGVRTARAAGWWLRNRHR